MMKKTIVMLVALGFGGAVYANSELDPCLNGEVSASGTHATQEAEDRAFAEMNDPCLVGDLG